MCPVSCVAHHCNGQVFTKCALSPVLLIIVTVKFSPNVPCLLCCSSLYRSSFHQMCPVSRVAHHCNGQVFTKCALSPVLLIIVTVKFSPNVPCLPCCSSLYESSPCSEDSESTWLDGATAVVPNDHDLAR